MRIHDRGLAAWAVMGLLLATPGVGRAFEILPSDDPEDAGQTLTVEREIVALTVVRSSAGFDDRLALVGDPPDAGVLCRSVPVGFTVPLGRFPTRTELALSLTTPDGDVWTSGPGAGNPDLVPHARITVTGPDTVLVEWEDLSGGGDADYDDCVVALKITALTP